MQKLEIIGNLTADPSVRTVNMATGSVTVCSFDVAVNRRGGNGKQTDFFRVSAWRGLGETCYKYLTKGSKVFVSGSVSCRAYTNKDGKLGASMDVNADEVEFLSSHANGNDMAGAFPSGAYTEVNSPEDLPWEQ